MKHKWVKDHKYCQILGQGLDATRKYDVLKRLGEKRSYKEFDWNEYLFPISKNIIKYCG